MASSAENTAARKVDTYAYSLLEAAKATGRVDFDPNSATVSSEASPETLAVLSSMATEGDLDMLPEVTARYRELAKDPDRVVIVDVTTAIALDDELRGLIQAKCENDFGREVFLVERVDPDIVGGIVFSVAGSRRDASVKHQFDAARQIMTQAAQGTEV